MATVYENYDWGVLVQGPGNVLAAHSFDEAAEKAAEINAALVKLKNTGKYDDEYYPVVFACVGIWGDIASGKHAPDDTVWANACA